MSFEANHMNAIHRGNYEEFFILYMDNELSDRQVKMVDEFLETHPDLKAEFEMLMGTKLPLEELSFDKTGLMADKMKLSSVDEELLLYIDDELPGDKKKTIEFELSSNKDYQLQHQVLLQTKLDPSEKIVYPNKKELYRREERVVSIKIWMRVAAAVMIIAVGGMFYFKDSTTTTATGDQPTASRNNPIQKIDSNKVEQLIPETASSQNSNNQIADNNAPEEKIKSNYPSDKKKEKEGNKLQQDEIVKVDPPRQKEDHTPERPKVRSVQFDEAVALTQPKVSINNVDVTYSPLPRPKDEVPTNPDGLIASNDRKGSIKGFLRKATRVIEKRTGIDPTNDGELLIGAVAINLK
jgi:hypothetical protein